MGSLKKVIFVGALLVWAGMGLSSLQAQEKFPSRGIDLIIPFAPGGPSDIGGRIYAEGLKKVLNVPIPVVNKPGASGTLSGAYVLTARRDGYTLLSGGGAWLVASLTTPDVSYDPLKDFIPISYYANTPLIFCVREDSPLKTLEDLIDKARKNPNTLVFGNGGGLRGEGFLCCEILRTASRVEFKDVIYAGDGPAIAALLGGHVDFTVAGFPGTVSYLKANKLRGLVISSANRLKEFPEIPTFKEKGFPPYSNWQGSFAPAGTPQNVVDALISASDEALKLKDVIDNFAKVNFQVERMSQGEFRNLLEGYKKFILEVAKRVEPSK